MALAPTVPTFLARTARAAEPERDGRVLVVIQLDGGNDAINTLVPFRDEGYAKHRKHAPARRKSADPGQRSGRPAPGPARAGALLERGQLALVPGVGLSQPQPLALREHGDLADGAARPGGARGPGWIGRGLDAQAEAGQARARPRCRRPLHRRRHAPGRAARPARRGLVPRPDRGPHLPEGSARSLIATRLGNGTEPDDGLDAYVRRSVLDAYCVRRPRGRAHPPRGRRRRSYPDTALAGKLRTVAQLLKADLGARVFYTVQSGYDTHAGQSNTHYQSALRAGRRGQGVPGRPDGREAGRPRDVLGFSEFGRRVAENGSAGTDHGTAGLVFLAGPGVRPGVHGKVPSLTDLVDGDPKIATDFRRVYATILEDWLGLPSQGPLGSAFEPMPLFRPVT